MVGRALSEAKKSVKRQREADIAMAIAVNTWHEEQLKPAKSRLGVRKIAEEHALDPTTLWRRVKKKGRTRSEYMQSLQNLTTTQERLLVDITKEQSDRGLPLEIAQIKEYAEAMMNGSKRKGACKLGKNWVPRFLARHHEELSTHWSSPLDDKRMRSMTPQAIEGHFRCVKETEEKYDIQEDCDFGMDESPFMLGCPAKKRVIVRKGTKTAHARRDGNRETLTVVETIAADGSTTPPTIIFRGKGFMKSWGGPENNPINAQSDQGYTDTVLGVAWIKNFDALTKEKANGRYRRVFLDNHKSHCTVPFLRQARASKIIVVAYPPHCTHALQGLDVACFGRLKVLWGKRLDAMDKLGQKVTKANFIRVYGEVRAEALTVATVRSAFAVTGIRPWNPSVIRPEQMAPSRSTSTTSSAPLPLPSPYVAVISAIREARFGRRIDQSPYPQSPGPENTTRPPEPAAPRGPAQHMTPVSAVPHRNIFPALRERIATNVIRNLGGTSAAYLVQNLDATHSVSSSDPIPPLAISPVRPLTNTAPPSNFPQIDPALLGDASNFGSESSHRPTSLRSALEQLDLLQKKLRVADERLEVANAKLEFVSEKLEAAEKHNSYLEEKVESYGAQLIIQDMYCHQMQQQLYGKENKTKTTREILADNGKREMTADEWIEALEGELNEKERIERLQEEKRRWKDQERLDRAAEEARQLADWQEKVAPYRAAKKRPPFKKPAQLKRAKTPERFAELKKKKGGRPAREEGIEILVQEGTGDDDEDD